MNFDLINKFQEAKKAFNCTKNLIADLEKEEIIGISKYENVKIFINGVFKISKIEISRELVKTDTVVLEKSVLEAVKPIQERVNAERTRFVNFREMNFSPIMIEEEMSKDIRNTEKNIEEYKDNFEKLTETRCTSTSSNGAVTVYFNLHGLICDIELNRQALGLEITDEDFEILTKELKSAFYEAYQECFELARNKAEDLFNK